MSPIKKRRRYEEEEKAEKLATENSEEITLERIQQAFAAVSSSSDNPKSNPEDLLQLALLQNRLLSQISSQEAEMSRLRAVEEKKQKERQAVAYETEILERQIAEGKRYPIPSLAQLAREETGKHEDTSVSDEEALKEFLQVDYMDSKEKPKILATLQTCFEQRAALGKTVQAKKQALQASEKVLKEHQDFLQQLPMHLRTIERSSSSVTKFMEKNNMVHPLSGTSERLQRLEHAKELAAPLYTLFTMIQRYIDSSSAPDEDCKLALANNHTQVTLKLPVPGIVSSGSKPSRSVSLTFKYNEEDNCIEVQTQGGAAAIHHESLLAELFPGDTSDNGRYSWAQYLAGLYPAATAVSVASTRWVLQNVRQRIQSNATLHHCLYSLERCHLPVIPNGGEDKPQTQLVAFQRADDASNSTSLYSITIRHPKGRELAGISVELVRARYPATPPVWKISDTTYAELEEHLNDLDSMKQLVEDKEAVDWIFVHQLHVLLNAWDRLEDATGRSVRGRDRKAIL